MISPTSTLPRHWMTTYDEDGDPYGEVCDCELGENHTAGEHHEDDCGDCQGSDQVGDDDRICPCDCHPRPSSPVEGKTTTEVTG